MIAYTYGYIQYVYIRNTNNYIMQFMYTVVSRNKLFMYFKFICKTSFKLIKKKCDLSDSKAPPCSTVPSLHNTFHTNTSQVQLWYLI